MAVVSDGKLVLEWGIREDDNLVFVELGQVPSEASVGEGEMLAFAGGEGALGRAEELTLQTRGHGLGCKHLARQLGEL